MIGFLVFILETLYLKNWRKKIEMRGIYHLSFFVSAPKTLIWKKESAKKYGYGKNTLEKVIVQKIRKRWNLFSKFDKPARASALLRKVLGRISAVLLMPK